MKRIASCAFGVSQNVPVTVSARPRMRAFFTALMMIQYQDISDITIRVMNTIQPTASSWVIRWSKPICCSAAALLPPAAAGAAAVDSCNIRLPLGVVDGVLEVDQGERVER